ncbi:signal peptidase II [Bosea sp. 47.2.35]|nr:signal peptidase II [Bosea sp. 47.2.35]
MSKARTTRRVLAWAAVALAADQISKWLILNKVMVPPRIIELTPFLNVRLGFNYGVSFGLGSEWLDAWPGALGLFKFVVAIGLLVWAAKSETNLEQIGLSLIAGGALGNATDRWRQGAVTDFIDLHWAGYHWPTFNGADIAISIGVSLILVVSLMPLNSRSAPSHTGLKGGSK